MKILILNGPNLNLLGRRRPDVYGSASLEEILDSLRREFSGDLIVDRQSNHEGGLIDILHGAEAEGFEGIVLNAGAYTHTSLALADAIEAISLPVVEVHLSNVAAREPLRHRSLIAPVCVGSISGFGSDSYRLGIKALHYRY